MMNLQDRRRFMGLLGALASVSHASRANTRGSGYGATGPFEVRQSELRLKDAGRDRELPLRLLAPVGHPRPPVVVYSHGLGGSVVSGEDWGRHWASHGIAALHVQHPGSDRTLLDGLSSRSQALERLKRGATPAQFLARVADLHLVIDKLAGPSPLADVDPQRIGVSGHSFGAQTTQALAGQRYAAQPGADFSRPDVRAFLAFSPAAQRDGAEDAFESVTRPFLSITGSADATPGLNAVGPALRVVPFRQMPPGGKYLLVVHQAEHEMFSGQAQRLTGHPPPDTLVLAVKAISTAFWRATLGDDLQARRWLDDEPAVRSVLQAADRWLQK